MNSLHLDSSTSRGSSIKIHGIFRHICDILAQGLIGLIRILIPQRYTFFSGSPTAKNSRVQYAWPGAISGWVVDWEIFLGVHE
jgi:hypothetical protein